LGKFTRINHPAARPVDSSEFNHFHTSKKIGRQEGIPPKEQKMSEKAREARRKLFESAAFIAAKRLVTRAIASGRTWLPIASFGLLSVADGRRNLFSPLPLLGFCELLAEGVEDTAAALR
jgi:hypothetical protein